MVCNFCGCILDSISVNSLCLSNSAEVDNIDKINYSDLDEFHSIPAEIINTKRHFFAPPCKDYETKIKSPGNKLRLMNFSNSFNNSRTNSPTRGITNFSNSFLPNLDSQIKIILEKMKKVANKTNLDLDIFILKSFNEKDIASNDIMKIYLQSKFELEEGEISKLINYFSHLNNVSISSFIDFIRKNLKNSKDELKNPFENNILNESKLVPQPKINSRYEESKNQPDWITKVANEIHRNNVNFYQVLNDYDIDLSGYITPDDIRMAFIKLQFNLTNNDIDNMLKYFNIQGMGKVNTREFARSFMSFNYTIPSEIKLIK